MQERWLERELLKGLRCKKDARERDVYREELGGKDQVLGFPERCLDRGMLCGQGAEGNGGGGVVEHLAFRESGYRWMLGGRNTGATLESGGMYIPPVPAGLCKPVYRAASCYNKLAKTDSGFSQGS